MIIEILTLFPEMFPGPLSAGVTGRGLASGLVTLRLLGPDIVSQPSQWRSSR